MLRALSNHPSLRALRRCVLYLLLPAMASCSNNSTIQYSYADPLFKKLDLRGVLVVGVAQEQSARAEFEDMFARALSRNGVSAVASHTLLTQEKPTADEIIGTAAANNLDTVLITRYMGASSEEIFHPGTIYYGLQPAYGSGYYRGFPGYYGHAYEMAYQQPVWTTNTTHKLISDLYVTASREHMWQAISDTIQAGSNRQLRSDAIASLIDDLKSQKLLD